MTTLWQYRRADQLKMTDIIDQGFGSVGTILRTGFRPTPEDEMIMVQHLEPVSPQDLLAAFQEGNPYCSVKKLNTITEGTLVCTGYGEFPPLLSKRRPRSSVGSLLIMPLDDEYDPNERLDITFGNGKKRYCTGQEEMYVVELPYVVKKAQPSLSRLGRALLDAQ